MTDQTFYSIRMHASADGKHSSGAERIVIAEKINAAVLQLIDRAMNKGCRPDQISVTIESLRMLQIRNVKALDVLTIPVSTVIEGRSSAARVLLAAGVAESAIARAISILAGGAAPGGENMRGAMIMDAATGERLEPDTARGIRASRFDWIDDAGTKMRESLAERDLGHFRTYEALALATKIAHGPHVVAELCWSDDADYTAGYVASLSAGYVRFPFLKEKNHSKGGRAIFIRRKDFQLDPFIAYLEKDPILITEPGVCLGEATIDHFIQSLS